MVRKLLRTKTGRETGRTDGGRHNSGHQARPQAVGTSLNRVRGTSARGRADKRWNGSRQSERRSKKLSKLRSSNLEWLRRMPRSSSWKSQDQGCSACAVAVHASERGYGPYNHGPSDLHTAPALPPPVPIVRTAARTAALRVHLVSRRRLRLTRRVPKLPDLRNRRGRDSLKDQVTTAQERLADAQVTGAPRQRSQQPMRRAPRPPVVAAVHVGGDGGAATGSQTARTHW